MTRNPSTTRHGSESGGQPVRQIGAYTVIAELGKGSSGAVYLARRPGIERLYALKLLPADIDPEGRARLEREARIASRLDHPDIVRAIDVGVHQDHLYLVMDHIPGEDLKERIAERGAHPWREAAELVIRIANAVHAAHTHGFIHRDLKPANIIIDGRDQRPKVTDFGLARDLTDTNLTRKGDLIGTPYYMCPEQVRGTPVDPRADVYALGVILYELLTGRRPFEAKGVHELSWKILKGEKPSPRKLAPDVPARLEEICLRAMAIDPAQRQQSAAELAEALSAVASGAGGGGRRREAAGARRPLPSWVWPVALAAGPLLLALTAAWPLAERGRLAPLEEELEETRLETEGFAGRLAEVEAERQRTAAAIEARAADLRLEDAARAEVARDADQVEAQRDELRRRLLQPDGHLGRAIDRWIEELAGEPGAALLRARLLRNRTRFAEALEVAREARLAGDPDPNLLIVEFRAAAAAGMGARQNEAAEEILSGVDPGHPTHAFARVVSGQVPPGEVADLLREVSERAPDAGYLQIFTARTLRRFGTEQRDVRVLEESLAAAERAIEVDPTSPDALRERVLTLAELRELRGPRSGDAARMVADCRLARELGPEPMDWFLAGQALLYEDDPEGAILELTEARDRALEAQDSTVAALSCAWLINAHLVLGDAAGAGDCFEELTRAGAQDAAVELADYVHMAGPELRARILGAVKPQVRDYLQEILRRRGG